MRPEIAESAHHAARLLITAPTPDQRLQRRCHPRLRKWNPSPPLHFRFVTGDTETSRLSHFRARHRRAWLNNTTITLGMHNVFDEDPPFVNSAIENGYDELLATIKGRFWYVQLKKRF
jgi:hypothetical protein